MIASPASAASIVPLTATVATLVSPSVVLAPLSGVIPLTARVGGVVSSVATNAAEVPMLPAASVACAVRLFTPAASVTPARLQLPPVSAVVVPNSVAPS